MVRRLFYVRDLKPGEREIIERWEWPDAPQERVSLKRGQLVCAVADEQGEVRDRRND